MCKCSYVNYGSQTHCLQSREYIHAAATDGFADFFATALFNSRVEDDGVFVNYKENWILNVTETWQVVDPPTAWNAYQVAPGYAYDRWMEKYCSDDMTNKGVGLDWLHFMYEMWTTGDNKFSVAELADVWADTAGTTKAWSELLATVGTQWGAGSDEYWLFYNKGGQAGVRH